MGFAYHPKDRKYKIGEFRGKKILGCFTAGGLKGAYTAGGENGDIIEALFHLNHGTLYYCGFDVLHRLFLGELIFRMKKLLKAIW